MGIALHCKYTALHRAVNVVLGPINIPCLLTVWLLSTEYCYNTGGVWLARLCCGLDLRSVAGVSAWSDFGGVLYLSEVISVLKFEMFFVVLLTRINF